MMSAMIARWFGATSEEHRELFAAMLDATPLPFLRWACRAILSWPGVIELPTPVRHIHGDRDRIIPVRRVNADRIVPGAGHLLTLTHPDAVNDFLAN
jgi:pimeloyl-ACP methyl ester carboxylesterase